MATLEQLQNAFVRADELGEIEDAKLFADSIRAHPTFQQNARESLESGNYKVDENFVPLEKNAERAEMSKLVARSLGLKDSEVDVTQGMGFKGRLSLSFQPTEQDKFKELEDRYGRENIQAIDIGGKTKLLYRDAQETNNQFRAVDEEGTSISDFFADTAGEVLPTAGAVAGAIGGSFLSPVLGTAAGSAAGYSTVAGLQDVAVRALSGEDIRPGEIAKRTAIETAFMAPFDLATAGLAKGITGTIGRNIAQDLTSSLTKAETILNKSEAIRLQGGLKLTPDMRVGQAATESASEIAASRPGSKIAERYARLRDNIAAYKQAATEGVTDTGESFGKAAQRIAGEYQTLIDDVAKLDKEAAKELAGTLSRRMNKLAAKDAVNMDKLGKRYVKLFESAQANVARQNAENFAQVNRIAAELKISASDRQVVDAIKGALKKFKVKENAKVTEILNEFDIKVKAQNRARYLKKQIASGKKADTKILQKEIAALEKQAGGVDFQTLRELIETVQDAIPAGGAVGSKTQVQVASVSADALRRLRDRVAKAGGKEFTDAYDNANKFYTDKMLSYQRGPAGRALAERAGGRVNTPSQVMSDILSDPAKVRQALDSIGPADEISRSAAQQEFQQAFLSKLGILETSSRELPDGIRLSNADRSVMTELFGERQLKSFDSLNEMIRKTKGADLSKITTQEVEELFGQYGTDAVKKLSKTIALRTAKEADAKKIADNVILRGIIKGDFSELTPHLFADALITGNTNKVKQAMSQILKGSPDEIAAVRQEYVSQFFARYSGGAQLDSTGAGIWNPQRLAADLAGKNGKTLRANMEAVLGKKQASEIIAANQVLDAGSALRKSTAPDIKPRFIFSPGNIAGYFVGDVMGAVRNRIMGWAYGTDALIPIMKLLNKKVAPEEFQKNFAKIISIMLSSERGIQALAREGDADPNFREAVNNSIRGANQSDPGISPEAP
jgi:hypothetical protein